MSKVNKWEKLESPARAAELAPAATLRRVGLHEGEIVCDIGAGSGLFSFAAAGITRSTVYAVDTDAEILAQLTQKAQDLGTPGILALPVQGCSYPLADASIDWVLLVTVLHEITQPDALMAELRRVLRPNGKILLIEFRKEPTPMGPPMKFRLGSWEAESLFSHHGFDAAEGFPLGENFYTQVYTARRG